MQFLPRPILSIRLYIDTVQQFLVVREQKMSAHRDFDEFQFRRTVRIRALLASMSGKADARKVLQEKKNSVRFLICCVQLENQ